MSTRSPVEFTDQQGRRVGNLVRLANLVSSGGTTVEIPLLVDSVTGALAVIDTAQEEGVITAGAINCINFADANNGFFAGDTNIIASTADGGQTWTAETGPATQAADNIINPNATPLADATIIFLIQTQARTVHITGRIGFGGDVELEIYRGTTFTGGTGTAMTVIAKNQSIALPGGYSTVRRDVTVTNVGTLLYNFFFPGGTGGNAQGVAARF